MAVETTDDLVQGSITPSRAVNTTAPLSGGGALTTDLTLDIDDFTGDSGAGGAKGTVPAPGAGDAAAGKFLKSDGSWDVPDDVVGDTGAGGTAGYVPAPGAGDAAAGKFLKADGSWDVPDDVVGDSGAGGTAGYVPAPSAGDAAANKYLNADGTWSHVTEETLGAHGESTTVAVISEEITLDTGGTTTDSTTNLLPANSEILGVVAYVTATIVTATDWKLGDDTTAGRFTAANSTLTAGTTDLGLLHRAGAISTDAAGAVQVAAAKLRITTTGTPSAGKVRVSVFYRSFGVPTS